MDALANILSPSTWPLRLEFLSIPAAMVLFALLAGFVLGAGWQRLAWLGTTRRAVAVGVRLGMIWVLVMLLGGLKLWQEHENVEVIILRDTSASIANVSADAPGARSRAFDRLLTDASTGNEKGPDDALGVIGFAATPRLERAPSAQWAVSAGTLTQPINREATDLAAAIQLGLASFSGEAMKRLVLITDGNMTRGDIEDAITRAVSQRVPIDVIPQRYSIQSEVVLDRLLSPASVRAGNGFTVSAIIYSTAESAIDARLWLTNRGVPVDVDAEVPGVQTSRLVRLQRGPTRVSIPIAAVDTSTLHAFRATVEPLAPLAAPADRPDTILANNTADACTIVRGRRRVLLVDHSHDSYRSLERALSLSPSREEEQGAEVVAIKPEEFPNRLESLESFDTVILANVPRGPEGLNDQQDNFLARYVEDLGGGLIVIGGPDALGAGNWQGTRIEKLLPVSLEPQAERSRRAGALVIVLDCSGSMNDLAPGEATRTKQRVANDSAALALRALARSDWIGVIAFDSTPRWIVRLAPNADPADADARVRAIGNGSGTAIGPALLAAIDSLRQLDQKTVVDRRIVLLTDGVSQPADYDHLLSTARSAGICISTVAIGSDADVDFLARLAGSARGESHIVRDSESMARVFVREARLLRRTLIHEPDDPIQLLPAGATASSPALDRLVHGGLPTLAGIVLTSSKQDRGATVLIRTDDGHGDPVLAIAQAGLGRVAVFTGDVTRRWAPDWVSSHVFGDFWRQLLSDTGRRHADGKFDVAIDPEGERSRIIVDAVGPAGQSLSFLQMSGRVSLIDGAGETQAVSFVQVGPGRYEAFFDTSSAGRYVAAIQYSSASGERGTLLGSTIVSDHAEYQATRSDDRLLKEIAQRTGGRELLDLREAGASLFSRQGLEPASSPLPLWDVLLAVTMGLLVVDVAVRRISWDTATAIDRVGRVFPLVAAFFATRQVDPDTTLDELHRARWLRENAEHAHDGAPQVPLQDSSPRTHAVPVITEPLPESRFDPRSRAKSWLERRSGRADQNQLSNQESEEGQKEADL